MTRSLRDRRTLTVVLGVMAVVGAAAGSVEDNENRLRSIPRERRVLLARKLDEFDSLPSAERAAVRQLDSSIAALPDADRAGHWAVLRRFHLLIQGLSETQRNEVDAAPEGKRMEVIIRIAGKQQDMNKKQAPQFPPLRTYYQVSSLAQPSAYDTANQVRIWMTLPKAQKDEVDGLADNARQSRLNQHAKKLKIAPVVRPIAKEASDDTAVLRAAKTFWFPALKRFEDPSNPKQQRVKRRLVEHFDSLEHPPANVSMENLHRFNAAIPEWVRVTLDPLPPEEARRRLTILYRVLYVPPEEFVASHAGPSPSVPTKSADSPPVAPRGKSTSSPASGPSTTPN